MMNKVCRIALLPATNAGISAATTATAHAGLGMNRQRQQHGGPKFVDRRLFSPRKTNHPPQLPNCRRVETASNNASPITTHTKESS
jgi:hypothetical protein